MRRLAFAAVWLTVLLVSTSAAYGKSYQTGPHWWFKDKELSGATEKLGITFKGGTTIWKDGAGVIECAKISGSGELVGGNPGTGTATMKYEGCEEKSLKCKARSPGASFGTVEVKTHTELVYFTKSAIEHEQTPLGVLFKTISSGEKEFVHIEFEGICSAENGVVAATGEEHGPGTSGLAGVACRLDTTIENPQSIHDVECLEGQQTKFWYWSAGKELEGKAGLEFKSEKIEQIIGKGEVELSSKEDWQASGASFPGWFRSGLEIGLPTVQAVFHSGKTIIHIKGLALPVTIECEKDTGFITLEPIGWATKGEWFLENCRVAQELGCKVANLALKFNNQLFFAAGTKKSVVVGVFNPEGGTSYGRIEVGECARKGLFALEGSVAGKVTPLEAEGEKVDLVFATVGETQSVTEVEAATGLTFKMGFAAYDEGEKASHEATLEGTEEEALESKEHFEVRR